MGNQVLIKKWKDINKEFTYMNNECDRLFHEWLKDRSNTILFNKYQNRLEERKNFIRKHKSYLIIP